MPRPKVLRSPHNLNITDGYTAVFTCDFEISTDIKIAQIHWLFNGSDLAGCYKLCIMTFLKSAYLHIYKYAKK